VGFAEQLDDLYRPYRGDPNIELSVAVCDRLMDPFVSVPAASEVATLITGWRPVIEGFIERTRKSSLIDGLIALTGLSLWSHSMVLLSEASDADVRLDPTTFNPFLEYVRRLAPLAQEWEAAYDDNARAEGTRKHDSFSGRAAQLDWNEMKNKGARSGPPGLLSVRLQNPTSSAKPRNPRDRKRR
jgi:hypothetical protein